MALNTSDAVTRVAPQARPNYLEAIRQGGPLFAQHGITTPLRLTHFLAQALHETGGFLILRENMNYSAPRLMQIFGVGHHSAAVTEAEAATLSGHPEAIAERVYGLGNPNKAAELGNTQPGDGFLYRGNGILQTTGRGNHRRMGAACGVDFEGQPELVIAAEHALKPALQEWTEGNLNARADENNIQAITRRINGGLNGLPDRQAWFNKLWPLLRTNDLPADPQETDEADAADNKVKWLQDSLNKLGADPQLVVDGDAGPATRRAVKAFQAAAGLTANGIADPVTKAAIKSKLETN